MCLPYPLPLYSLPSYPLWSFERYPELLPPVDLRLVPLLFPSHSPALLSSSLKLPACSLRTRPITQQGAPQASCSIRRNIDECLWMGLGKVVGSILLVFYVISLWKWKCVLSSLLTLRPCMVWGEHFLMVGIMWLVTVGFVSHPIITITCAPVIVCHYKEPTSLFCFWIISFKLLFRVWRCYKHLLCVNAVVFLLSDRNSWVVQTIARPCPSNLVINL